MSPEAEQPRRCWISIGSNVDRERSIRGGLKAAAEGTAHKK